MSVIDRCLLETSKSHKVTARNWDGVNLSTSLATFNFFVYVASHINNNICVRYISIMHGVSVHQRSILQQQQHSRPCNLNSNDVIRALLPLDLASVGPVSFTSKQESVRPRWPYDMWPSARAEKYMCVIVIR